jgi:hypothetical protein
VDMRRYLKPNLDVPTLQALGGEYEGIVAHVTSESLRNKFTGTTSEEPVIAFNDGKRLILNKTLLVALMRTFGDDSGAWIGRRIRSFFERLKR